MSSSSATASSEKKAMNTDMRFQPRMSGVTKNSSRLEMPPRLADREGDQHARAGPPHERRGAERTGGADERSQRAQDEPAEADRADGAQARVAGLAVAGAIALSYRSELRG